VATLDAACEEACRSLALPEEAAGGAARAELPRPQQQALLAAFRHQFPLASLAQAERCAALVDAITAALPSPAVVTTTTATAATTATATTPPTAEFGAGIRFTSARVETEAELEAYRREEAELVSRERTAAHLREARMLAAAAAEAELGGAGADSSSQDEDEDEAEAEAEAEAAGGGGGGVDAAAWLQDACLRHFGSSDSLSADQIHAAIVELLRSPRTDDQLQNDLFELLGFDRLAIRRTPGAGCCTPSALFLGSPSSRSCWRGGRHWRGRRAAVGARGRPRVRRR